MGEENHLSTNVVVRAEAAPATHEVAILNPEVQVLFLTWVTFFILLAILYKFAWKPILQALDDREAGIRKAVEEADKTHAEYQKIEEKRKQLINEAQVQAKEIVDQSRKAAVNAAKAIEQKTSEQAAIVLENAQREIRNEKEKADALLLRESAEIAVALAGKIIAENLNDDRNKKLVDRLIKEI